MAVAVVMPKAGITVETCIIGEWLKKPGDKVEIGDVLFTYETDKASFECESTAGGELLATFFDAGDEAPCLVNVCAIGTLGEDYSDLRPDGDGAPAPAATIEAPANTAAQTAAVPEAETRGESGISPRARSLAERSGVDLSAAAGTGPNGRIIERDVRQAMSGVPGEAPAVTAMVKAPVQAVAANEYEDVKFSGIRRVIAKTMYESLQSMAQLTHNHSFDATAIKAYRAMLKAAGGEASGVTLGDMILFAVSRTLKDFPDLNANMSGDNMIRRYTRVNLGVAVDTDRGLMVPTVFNADMKSLLEISREVKELAAMCRAGSISPDLLKGGTFTVTNLGAFGVESFTPVINPPQTGILGVCAISEKPRTAKSGTVELYPAMGLSLTYDHRAIDGAPASRFMQALCGNLESFTALLAL